MSPPMKKAARRYIRSTPNVNNSTPNTLQVLNELLPELKSNTVTPPSDDGIDTLPATEDVSATESVN